MPLFDNFCLCSKICSKFIVRDARPFMRNIEIYKSQSSSGQLPGLCLPTYDVSSHCNKSHYPNEHSQKGVAHNMVGRGNSIQGGVGWWD